MKQALMQNNKFILPGLIIGLLARVLVIIILLPQEPGTISRLLYTLNLATDHSTPLCYVSLNLCMHVYLSQSKVKC